MNSSRTQLRIEELLSTGSDQLVGAVQKRIRHKLEQHNHSLILFGAGELGRRTLENLRRIGIQPVAFADNNAALNGTTLHGIPILLPKDARTRFRDSLWVIAVYTNAPVWKQLDALGVASITFAELSWCYADELLPWLGLELQNKIFAGQEGVRAAFALWA